VRYNAQATGLITYNSSVPNHKGQFLGPFNTLFTGYREVINPEAMQLRHEADHSPPSSAEVKKKKMKEEEEEKMNKEEEEVEEVEVVAVIKCYIQF